MTLAADARGPGINSRSSPPMIEHTIMTAALGNYVQGCTSKACDGMWRTFLVIGHVCHVRSQAGNATATFAIDDIPIIAAGSESCEGYWMGHRQPQRAMANFDKRAESPCHRALPPAGRGKKIHPPLMHKRSTPCHEQFAEADRQEFGVSGNP